MRASPAAGLPGRYSSDALLTACPIDALHFFIPRQPEGFPACSRFGYDETIHHPRIVTRAMDLVVASKLSHIENARHLFKEYADSLNFSLCFQNFAAELADLPGDYASPAGRLLLALQQEQPAGCIALRPLRDKSCEMKRLYVRPVFRGSGIGKRLAEALIFEARQIGYQKICLDTVAAMKQAQLLYESLGFVDAKPYYHNPLEGVRFMELSL